MYQGHWVKVTGARKRVCRFVGRLASCKFLVLSAFPLIQLENLYSGTFSGPSLYVDNVICLHGQTVVMRLLNCS